MAPTVASLKKVDGHELDKKTTFLVRIVRLWSVPKRGEAERTRLLHMVLKDEACDRIQATIEESLIKDFNDDIEEHGLYLMKNFRVVVNNETYKPASHPYRLFFQENTQILPESLHHYSKSLLSLYNFKNVDDCLRVPQSNVNHLIDFIGAYNPEEGFTTGQNRQGTSTFISFNLRDPAQKQIKCALWDRYADAARSTLEGSTKKFNVVILQLVRIVRWDATSLSTSYHVSKVIIDEHIPEIEDFRTQYLAAQESLSHSSSQLSRSSSKSSLSGPVRTIDQLLDAKNVRGFYFYGKITRILVENGWYYKGCPDPTCAKKVDAIGDEFVCTKCENRVMDPVARYKIKYEVADGKSKAFVVFWDELSQRLFGKTVVEFVNELGESDGLQAPPKEIVQFVGKTYLFRVVGYTTNDVGVRTYNINTVDDDPDTIAMNKPSHHSSNAEGDNSDDDLTLLSRNTTEVNSKENFEVEDEEVLTPSSKRSFDHDNVVDEDVADTTQGSTNKKMKGVKIEKD